LKRENKPAEPAKPAEEKKKPGRPPKKEAEPAPQPPKAEWPEEKEKPEPKEVKPEKKKETEPKKKEVAPKDKLKELQEYDYTPEIIEADKKAIVLMLNTLTTKYKRDGAEMLEKIHDRLISKGITRAKIPDDLEGAEARFIRLLLLQTIDKEYEKFQLKEQEEKEEI